MKLPSCFFLWLLLGGPCVVSLQINGLSHNIGYTSSHSVEKKWFMLTTASGVPSSSPSKKNHIAVIGAGWAGFGAAKALCEAGCKVTLIDVVRDPTGTLDAMTPTGKPIEPGQKGFWYDYPNIGSLVKELGLKESDIFTEFLNSSFYSPSGLEAVAPVFSSSTLPQLPSPLGQVFASFHHFKRLPISDRASIAGLLYAMLDLYRDEKTFKAYDRMSAYDLFLRVGVTKRLLDDFLRPTLLVGLFKPPEELSAAVTLELLYYYALAHQSSFDVRWLKKGTVASEIFRPLSAQLRKKYDLTVLGSSRVTKLIVETQSRSRNDQPPNARISGLEYTTVMPPSSAPAPPPRSLTDLDGVVLAVGVNGLKSILRNSPELSALCPQLSTAATMNAIDCISARFWLEETVSVPSPANVFASFPQLRGAGGTFFTLDTLQKDHLDTLWGSTPTSASTTMSTSDPASSSTSQTGGGRISHSNNNLQNQPQRGSVIGVDFYNAGALSLLENEEIEKIIFEELLPSVQPKFRGKRVVDRHIQRYPGAVSWFSPGSYPLRPRTKVPEITNLACAGDWVVLQDPTKTGGSNTGRGGVLPFSLDEVLGKTKDFNVAEHGAKGLCQERAYVSGLMAANTLLVSSVVSPSKSTSVKASASRSSNNPVQASSRRRSVNQPPRLHRILPIRSDEWQVTLGRSLNRQVFSVVNTALSPLTILRDGLQIHGVDGENKGKTKM